MVTYDSLGWSTSETKCQCGITSALWDVSWFLHVEMMQLEVPQPDIICWWLWPPSRETRAETFRTASRLALKKSPAPLNHRFWRLYRSVLGVDVSEVEQLKNMVQRLLSRLRWHPSKIFTIVKTGCSGKKSKLLNRCESFSRGIVANRAKTSHDFNSWSAKIQ